jgi:hypothetical protein
MRPIVPLAHPAKRVRLGLRLLRLGLRDLVLARRRARIRALAAPAEPACELGREAGERDEVRRDAADEATPAGGDNPGQERAALVCVGAVRGNGGVRGVRGVDWAGECRDGAVGVDCRDDGVGAQGVRRYTDLGGLLGR